MMGYRWNSEPTHDGPISLWWCSSCSRWCQILHSHDDCKGDDE